MKRSSSRSCIALACWAGLSLATARGASVSATQVGAWDIGMTPHEMAEIVRTNAVVEQVYVSDNPAHYMSQADFSEQDCVPDRTSPVIGEIYRNWEDTYRFTPGKIVGGLLNDPKWLQPDSEPLRCAVKTSLRIEPSLAVVLAEGAVRLMPNHLAEGYAYSVARLMEAYRRAGETNLLRQLAAQPERFHPPPRPANRWIEALGLVYQPTTTVEQVVQNLCTAVFLGDLPGARCYQAALPDGLANRYALDRVVHHMGEGLAEGLPAKTKPLVTSLLANLSGELKGRSPAPMEKRMAVFSDERCVNLLKLCNDIYGHMDTRTVDQFLYLVEKRAGPGYLSCPNWPRPQDMIYLAINATRIYGGLRALPLYPVVQCRGMNPPEQPESLTWHDRFNAMESSLYATVLAGQHRWRMRRMPALYQPLLRMTGHSTNLAWDAASTNFFPAIWEHRYSANSSVWRLDRTYERIDRSEAEMRRLIEQADAGQSDAPSIDVLYARCGLRDLYLARKDWRRAAEIYDQFARGLYHKNWIRLGIVGLFDMADRLGDGDLRRRALAYTATLPPGLTPDDVTIITERARSHQHKEASTSP